MEPSWGTAVGWGCILGRGERWRDQLSCESQSTLVASLGGGGLLRVPPNSSVPLSSHPAGAQTGPNLVWGLLSPTRSIAFLCYTLPECFCSLPDMCFMLTPPRIKSWLESMLSNSEGAFHFPTRSGSFKHLCSSHFKDGNRRKHLLLCLENIINVFWLHKPALIENMQTQRVQGG